MAHKHPGVTLMKEQPAREWIDPKTGATRRSGAIYHRARYRDPASGTYKYETLPQTFVYEKQVYATRHKQARQLWAKLKSDQLLVDGAKHRTKPSAAPGSAPLPEVIDQYFNDKPRLGKATVEQKRRSLDNFLSWCADHKIHNTDELTADTLRNWRTFVESRGRRVPVKGDGEGQGTKRQTDKPRADWSIASEIGHVAAALKHLRSQREHFRHIDADDFAERLKPFKVKTRRKKKPLSRQDLPRVVRACMERDAEAHPNGTARHPAVAPFFAFMLLTGLRPGEARDLDWDAVELDEDDGGEGVIYIHASKTDRERMVELRVSPACRRLLIAMQERDGGDGRVWTLSKDEIKSAYRSIRSATKVKHFSPQVCRVSTGSYLINSGIYSRSVERRTAEQLGHDERTARSFYWGSIRGLDQDKRSLESVMGIESEVEQIIASIQPKARRRKSA